MTQSAIPQEAHPETKEQSSRLTVGWAIAPLFRDCLEHDFGRKRTLGTIGHCQTRIRTEGILHPAKSANTLSGLKTVTLATLHRR